MDENPYKDLLERLVRKCLEIDKASKEVFASAFAHGVVYKGPDFTEELDEAIKLLRIEEGK